MTDNRGANLSRLMLKTAGRAKEKVSLTSDIYSLEYKRVFGMYLKSSVKILNWPFHLNKECIQ